MRAFQGLVKEAIRLAEVSENRDAALVYAILALAQAIDDKQVLQ